MLGICQINRFDHGGGSEVVAWNLLHAYRALGHDACLVVGRKLSRDPNVWLFPHERTVNPWRRFWWRRHWRWLDRGQVDRRSWKLSRLAHRLAAPASIGTKWLGHEDFSYPGVWRLFQLFSRPPQIVHAHNLHGDYFDLRALPWLSHEVPLVLTLHDAWLLSGHCTHSLECERWKIGCGQCPDLSLPAPILRDGSAYNWRRKRDIFARSKLFVSAPSRWLMRKIEQSMLAPGIEEARVIPNGTDLRTFCPGSQADSRTRLGLPAGARILLFAAQDPQRNVWKDFETLRQALAGLGGPSRSEQLLLLSLGDSSAPMRVGRHEIRFVPFQTSAPAVADYYRAADVYVHAAKADTFPNAVIEAQACGCPVIGTSVGGIPEQVEPGVTGFLVSAGDVSELSNRIGDLLLDSALRHRMGQAGAARAAQLYDLRRQVDTYLNWYEDILAVRQRCAVDERFLNPAENGYPLTRRTT
jgi:glycosyltransferase involved in cell wall biosynthesis